MRDITVSVVMITYNHEKFIKEALESVFSQKTNFQYEIIISNDCSTDNTDEVIKKIIDKNENGEPLIVDIIKSGNVDFLNKCRKSALYTASKQGWAVIPCSDGEKPLPIEEIHNTILDFVKKVMMPGFETTNTSLGNEPIHRQSIRMEVPFRPKE